MASWGFPFLAEPEEVAALRGLVRTRLSDWGLQELSDSAQLCVSELVSNVITHVGRGTPASLSLSLRGARLRIELRDPDARALPTLVEASDEAESGRGMALVDALTERWGVELHDGSKVTWCELVAIPAAPDEQAGARATRAAKVLSSYGDGELFSTSRRSRLGAMAAEAAAIDIIADLLHWLQTHGHDTDEILDRAQMHFEAELEATRVSR
ncbi:regulator [Streptomyces caelestis]|uniref:Regulator n=1 Tax=Streptomyces caelestis TaxID=36816 RepID=A0A0M8QQL7_9ACTN|nr:ATP-binding protein [Streptomyces caelestis]KOT44818.1 regulator [Streptomyces caelestis]